MVDADNVLNDLQEVVIKRFNDRYGTTYTMKDFDRYNVSECLNKNDAIKMQKMYGEHGLYDDVHPLSDAQGALQKLHKAGHEVYVVTDSIPDTFGEKVNWIKFHFPMIDNAHIIAMKHKWLFKCDAMVEDNLDNLLGAPYYERICFDYPWNRHVHDAAYDIHRVSSWENILTAINEINKKRM